MSRKTRKLMWSVPLIAAVAVIGVLALFLTLQPSGAQAQEVMVPGPVTDLEATAKSRSSIELTWTAPDSSAGGTPTGYRVDYSNDNREWVLLTADTESTATRLLIDQGINTETRRHYRVFAINEAGTGPVSKDPVTAFVSVADTYPAVAPSRVILSLSVVGPNQIDLSWTEPTDTGGASITGYRVVEMVDENANASDARTECNVPSDAAGGGIIGTFDPGGTGTAENCLHITVGNQETERTAKHEDLNAGSTHYYRVIVMTSAGTSASDVRGARTTAPQAPSAPREPVAVTYITGHTNADDIDLYWIEPSSHGGHALGDHIVEARVRTRPDADSPYSRWSGWVEIDGSTELRAADNTVTPNLAAVTVDEEAPTNPTNIGNPGSEFNLRITGASDGQYEFRMRAAQNDMPTDKGLNLKSGWAYFNGGRTIQVPATQRDVEQGSNDFTLPSIIPLQPSLEAEPLESERVRDQGIRLTWTASAGGDGVVGLNDKDSDNATPDVNDDGPIPSDFRVDYADMPAAGAADQTLKWQPGQTRTVTLNHWDNEGLEAGLTRYYRLFPINGNVFGQAAIAGNTVEVANVADPDQVLNLRQTGKTTISITMGWTALPGRRRL